MGRVFLICSCVLVSGAARAQDWISADVGSVGVAGSASSSAGVWTILGSGDDIWGANDAFQFVHQTTSTSGFVLARVTSLQASNPFAKAGVMVRASLADNAATAILDLKPDGGIEFMARASTGQSMQYLGGTTVTAPVWLKLSWSSGTVTAATSSDGTQWTVLCATTVNLPAAPESGVAVTSHDNTVLATATVDRLSAGNSSGGRAQALWHPQPIGSGAAGGGTERNGTWTMRATGTDIWGTSDSFEYLSHTVIGSNFHIVARIDDLQNTNGFAKAGVMLRASADPSAAAVILDVIPGGQLEFMARSTNAGEMMFLGGAPATFPVWLQLSWSSASNGSTDVVGSMSTDGVNWTPVGTGVQLALPDTYTAGVAVTSHNSAQSTTAHIDGLTLLPNGWIDGDIGARSLLGNAAIDTSPDDTLFTVEGAGSDIWGGADSFNFVQLPSPLPDHFALIYRVVSIANTNAFAKAGMMFRDGSDAAAPSVILDAKPDGGVEFMARLCGQCATTYLGGANIVFPAFLSLTRDGATFTAAVFNTDPGDGSTIGAVAVPMSAPLAGFAVTSHDANHTTTAVFDNPAR